MKWLKKLNLYNYFYILIFGSVFGWIIEGLWTLLKKGVLINHSALVIGPFNLAYGICAVFLTALLYKFANASYFKIFIIGFLGGSILEYLMSFGMEKVLGFTAWDYSKKFLNINGRICLLYSLFWGLIGIVWIKLVYPKIIKFIESFDKKKGKIFIYILSIFLIFDAILTGSAIKRARNFDMGIAPKNSYERFLDKTFNTKYLTNMFNNNWEKK